MAKRKKKKGNPTSALAVVIAVIFIAVSAFLYFTGRLDGLFDGIFDDGNVTPTPTPTVTPTPTPDLGYETDELSVHFLELGNKYTGDCTLIDIGETEILIDAGSRQNSASAIVPYVNEYCSDGVIEYVIATHAHQDHIAGFVGSKSAPGVFESFKVGTIIDFPRTNATSSIYAKYLDARAKAVENGATHYTALECWNNINGATRTYKITEDISFSILYNYYYENNTSDENDYSVCILLTQGDKNFLFTGDLEGEGEKKLVENNALPQVELFKGGHHGSYTANTDALLSVIRPKRVAVCCCCGSTEYTSNNENTFPSQAFCDRVSKYTDEVYVTTVVSDGEDGYESMNGNIVVVSDGVNVTVHCSNNNLYFKDTDWCKKNRRWGY